ncbi:MAG: hypothetical protein HN919_00665 [Verrucomicrobia bacterium]|jgi:hypothetical protein|nr:hypothetical protein [Verrucomicrobiota bacterium]MBT7064790.1 hypothetical protein [Verrucomicrobiota bacterium]MBT7700576.1 hypothetical protein [Verrucomicrobiota bacterium]
MSIVSDALKKVEGNSTAVPTPPPVAPPDRAAASPVELVDALSKSTPPLFSVWSVLLSTIMVLVAVVLLLATWYTNRSHVMPPPPPAALEAAVADVPPSPSPLPAVSPVAAIPVSVPAVKAKAPVAVVGEEETPGGLPVKAPKPTAPVEAAPAEALAPIPPAGPRRDELELTGVVYTHQTRMAHINGRILSEGGEIAGYKVIRISRESVRVSKGGKFFILKPKH